MNRKFDQARTAYRQSTSAPPPAPIHPSRRLALLRKTQPRANAIKHNKLALKENTPKDGEADPIVPLDTSITSRSADRCVLDVRAGRSPCLTSDVYAEVWQRGRARENVAALASRVSGAGDLGVVSIDDVAREVEQGCACVRDAGDLGSVCGATDSEARGGEIPEAGRVVHGSVRDAACVL